MLNTADIQLHSRPAYWECSQQGNWERFPLAMSEHYTIYNAASCSDHMLVDLSSKIFWEGEGAHHEAEDVHDMV